jgi:hypothetical protein
MEEISAMKVSKKTPAKKLRRVSTKTKPKSRPKKTKRPVLSEAQMINKKSDSAELPPIPTKTSEEMVSALGVVHEAVKTVTPDGFRYIITLLTKAETGGMRVSYAMNIGLELGIEATRLIHNAMTADSARPPGPLH